MGTECRRKSFKALQIMLVGDHLRPHDIRGLLWSRLGQPAQGPHQTLHLREALREVKDGYAARAPVMCGLEDVFRLPRPRNVNSKVGSFCQRRHCCFRSVLWLRGLGACKRFPHRLHSLPRLRVSFYSRDELSGFGCNDTAANNNCSEGGPSGI